MTLQTSAWRPSEGTEKRNRAIGCTLYDNFCKTWSMFDVAGRFKNVPIPSDAAVSFNVYGCVPDCSRSIIYGYITGALKDGVPRRFLAPATI